MKRFLVFSGDCYYPGGGWHDFIDSYDTIEDAKQHVSTLDWDFGHIVDSKSGKIIVSYTQTEGLRDEP